MDGVVRREFSADSGDEANVLFNTGFAMIAGINPQKATRAINTSIICLMTPVLSLRYP